MPRIRRALKQNVVPLVTALARFVPPTSAYSGLGHILSFHRVVPERDVSPNSMSAFEITPQMLELILEFFRERRYDIVTLDEMKRRIEQPGRGARFVALTFDDGYKDTLTTALPVLRRYEAPFTINVTVGYVDRTAIKWDYLASEVVGSNEQVGFETEQGPVILDCSSAAGKRESFGRLAGRLHRWNHSDALPRMKDFFARYTPDPYRKTEELMMDWTQLKEISRDPLVRIGSHCINHYVLRDLSDEDARQEIARARERLEREVDAPVNHFCYPYGTPVEIGERELELVRSVYDTGTTGTKGNIFPEHAEHLEALPRFNMGMNCDRAYLSTIANGSLPLLVNRFKKFATV